MPWCNILNGIAVNAKRVHPNVDVDVDVAESRCALQANCVSCVVPLSMIGPNADLTLVLTQMCQWSPARQDRINATSINKKPPFATVSSQS